MIAIYAAIVVLANVVTAARLIGYQRRGARYRFWMSLLAYVLIVCAGGQVIDVLINHAQPTGFEAGFSAVIAVLVWRARGNVACIVRMMT